MSMKRKLGEIVINALQSDPEGWRFSDHCAYYGDFILWIANRPYADLREGELAEGFRIGTWLQRRRIRTLIDSIKMERISKSFTTLTRGKQREGFRITKGARSLTSSEWWGRGRNHMDETDGLEYRGPGDPKNEARLPRGPRDDCRWTR